MLTTDISITAYKPLLRAQDPDVPSPIAQKGSILPPQGALSVMIAYICTRSYGRFFSHRDIGSSTFVSVCDLSFQALDIAYT